MKEFIVTKSSVMEIKNLFMNTKSTPVKSNSKQYQFLFKFPAKKKHYLVVICVQKKFFLKTLAQHNCSGVPFRCQRYRVQYNIIHHYQHPKIIQSIRSIYQIICEIHLV